MTIGVDQIFIKVNGTAIEETTMDALLDAEISTSLGLPGMFILRFKDPELKLIDDNKFPLGDPVQVEIDSRSEGSKTLIIKGEITAIEPDFQEGQNAILTVRGYDKSHRLNRGTKSRVFVNSKDSDIVQTIANGGGLSPAADTTAEVHEHVYQDNQSDLAFLHMLPPQARVEMWAEV